MKKFLSDWFSKTDDKGFLNPKYEKAQAIIRTIVIGITLLIFLLLMLKTR